MSKPSLAAALQTLDRSPAPAKANTSLAMPEERKPAAASAPAPSRVGKKALIGYFDPSVSKQLKQLALDHDSTAQELLREAINDLFQKYKKPSIA